ncbi:hypothetical protein GCM10023093_22700 [Nemorincola caseinilytica]|uniref:Uncharacterized protein n=1 Tax=Nemorincola caseinilytica TaxID=2054315 RepID=A0ABP8NK34_9BACT
MRTFIAGTVFFSAIFFGSCRKTDSPEAGRTYMGQVVENICGNIAVEFTDGTRLGETWTTSTGTKYKNIFKVANPCTWRPGGGKSPFVKFVFVPQVPQTCAQCLLAVEMPSTEYHIQVVE